MNFSDETLMAYADGELDPAQRATIERVMREDPAVAAAVERHRALRQDVNAAFAGILDEPVPPRLAPDTATRVVQLDAARAARSARLEHAAGGVQQPIQRRRWAWPEWGALAATLALGVLLGRGGPDGGGTPAMVGQDGALVAQGELAQALDQQLGGQPGGAARISVSFAAEDGSYCRGFVYGPSAGLACRDNGRWRIPVLTESTPSDGGAYRQASSALPLAVLEAIDARIAGAPLDAAGEQAARSQGWSPAQKK